MHRITHNDWDCKDDLKLFKSVEPKDYKESFALKIILRNVYSYLNHFY